MEIKQIQIFEAYDLSVLQDQINSFLMDKNHESISDIKYNITVCRDVASNYVYSGMIIYVTDNDEF